MVAPFAFRTQRPAKMKKKTNMNTQQQFIIRYGLQHFVTYAKSVAGSMFSIDAHESRKMIDHATRLIREQFGDDVIVRTA